MGQQSVEHLAIRGNHNGNNMPVGKLPLIALTNQNPVCHDGVLKDLSGI